MEEDYGEGSDTRAVLENVHGDERVLCYLSLAVDESDDHKAADDEECDHFSGVPGEKGTTKVETEEDHQGEAEESDHAGPIECADAVDERGMFMADVEEEDDENSSKSTDWKVDVDCKG